METVFLLIYGLYISGKTSLNGPPKGLDKSGPISKVVP